MGTLLTFDIEFVLDSDERCIGLLMATQLILFTVDKVVFCIVVVVIAYYGWCVTGFRLIDDSRSNCAICGAPLRLVGVVTEHLYAVWRKIAN